jgi:mevalonate kinase
MEVRNRQGALGEAHGKLILVGEHVVVYDKPAIAIPFPLKVRV